MANWRNARAVLADGTLSAPALTFAAGPGSGIYRIGANNIGISVNGAKVLDVSTTGLTVTGALSATGDFAINTNKFTVAAASGNTVVAGTLAAGATTITGVLSVEGAAQGNVTIRKVGTSGIELYSSLANTGGIWLQAAGADVMTFSTAGVAVTGALTATTGFGCNGASAQTAYASGGAATDAATTQTLANNIRLALIANGIMS